MASCHAVSVFTPELPLQRWCYALLSALAARLAPLASKPA